VPERHQSHIKWLIATRYNPVADYILRYVHEYRETPQKRLLLIVVLCKKNVQCDLKLPWNKSLIRYAPGELIISGGARFHFHLRAKSWNNGFVE
jgi:hypothetical protein